MAKYIKGKKGHNHHQIKYFSAKKIFWLLTDYAIKIPRRV